MSEPTSSGPPSHLPDPHAFSASGMFEPQNALVRLGGALGVAASCIGLLIFFGACAGFDAAFRGFPILPLILGSLGLILSLIGVLIPRHAPVFDTNVLAAFFVSVIGILGALVEIAVWQKWALFSMTGT